MRQHGIVPDPNGVHAFVDEYIDSFVGWDILLFFHRNPDAVETASSLAKRLGRGEPDVKEEINRLVKKGVLTPADGGTFHHAPDPQLASRIRSFNAALAEAPSRMTILSQGLGKRRQS